MPTTALKAPNKAQLSAPNGFINAEWLAWLQDLADRLARLDERSAPETPTTGGETGSGDTTIVEVTGTTGGGTTERLAKWVAPSQLGDSLLVEEGGVVRADGTLAGFALQGLALTAGHALVAGTDGVLAGEAQLAPARGGLGFDASTAVLGDLLVGSGPGAFARFAVGTDGQILTADSTAPQGVVWGAAPSGGGSLSLLTNGDPTSPELVFDSNGDVIVT